MPRNPMSGPRAAWMAVVAILASILGASGARSDDGLGGLWMAEGAATAKPEVEDVAGIDPAAHGTYRTIHYYAFVASPLGDQLTLISDAQLQLLVVPVKESPGVYSLQQKGSGSGAYGTLSVNKNCLDLPRCFEVRGTDPQGELPPGRYVPFEKATSRGLTQKYGDMFSNLPPNFQLVKTCYDLTKMSLDDFQQSACPHDLFAEPPDDSFDYTRASSATGEIYAIPFGWKYASRAEAEDSAFTQFVSTGQDLMHAYSTTVGFNLGFDLFGLKLGVNANTTTRTKVEKMYTNELTYSHSNYLGTDFAMVVDKGNLLLGKDFQQAVYELQQSSRRPEDFEKLFASHGTHYAYASTFGRKGYQFNTYTKQDVVNIVDKQVDVGGGIDLGFSEEGIGGGNAGGSGAGARENYQKLENIVGNGLESIKCIGFSCDPNGAGVWPVLLDLRPISELLGPPFYTDWDTAVTLRAQLGRHLKDYAFYEDNGSGEPAARFARVRFSVRCAEVPVWAGRGPQVRPGTDLCNGFTVTGAQLSLPGSGPPVEFDLNVLPMTGGRRQQSWEGMKARLVAGASGKESFWTGSKLSISVTCPNGRPVVMYDRLGSAPPLLRGVPSGDQGSLTAAGPGCSGKSPFFNYELDATPITGGELLLGS